LALTRSSHGAPTIKGRRLTVYSVITKIYYEDSLKTALEDFESTLDEAKGAVNYCRTLKTKIDIPN
jgi:uncharacterized protein (DUF433 family)